MEPFGPFGIKIAVGFLGVQEGADKKGDETRENNKLPAKVYTAFQGSGVVGEAKEVI